MDLTNFKFENDTQLEDIRKRITANDNPNPRNSMLNLFDSVSKISAKFRNRTDDDCAMGLPEWSPEERESLKASLNGTLESLIKLSNECHIDLADAIVKKIKQNEKKYPIDKIYGLARKYTEI